MLIPSHIIVHELFYNNSPTRWKHVHLEVKILRYSRFENLFVAVVVKIIFVREQIQKMSQHHIKWNGMGGYNTTNSFQ